MSGQAAVERLHDLDLADQLDVDHLRGVALELTEVRELLEEWRRDPS